MKATVPGVLDRLLGEHATGRLGLEQLKDSVARDLEALLNTRTALDPDGFIGAPLAQASVLNYGLTDFAAYCLSSSEDRAAICASLKTAIERHEPRLHNVNATLAPAQGGVNRLEFVIHATLRTAQGGAGATATVDFNAVLQPSSLHYAVNRAGRTSHP